MARVNRDTPSVLFLVFTFAVLCCVSTTRLDATCVVAAVASVAPTDGGTATYPALLTPVPATPPMISVTSSNEAVSDLLIFDNGATPACFSSSQVLRIQYSATITSPTVISTGNLNIWDSDPVSGVNISPSVSSTRVQIVVTVLRAGTAGNLTTGRIGSAIRIKGIRADGRSVEEGVDITATITGTVAGTTPITGTSVTIANTGRFGPVLLDPSTISFPGTIVGQRASGPPIRLVNQGTLAMTVSIKATGDYSQTNSCGTSLAASASCQIFPSFLPTTIGTRSGTIAVSDRAPGSPHLVQLTGTGLTPEGPRITSIDPAGAAAGTSTLGLTVRGSNFTGNSTVLWNGAAHATKAIDSATLTAVITSSDLLTEGTAAVAVSTPGAGTSASATFTVRSNPMPKGSRHYLPHVVSGGGFVTKITIVNPGSVPASATVNFISQGGQLLKTTSFAVGPRATVRLSTPESDRFAGMTTQWAVIGSDLPLVTNLFFELTDSTGKQVVNSVGFNHTPPLTEFSIPMEFEPGAGGGVGRTAGVAVANASGADNTVTFDLADANGNIVASYQVVIPPFGQTAFDLSQVSDIAPKLPKGNFLGTLLVSAIAPVSAIALEDDFGPFSAVPVRQGRSLTKVDRMIAACPSATEIAAFNKDLTLTFEADDTAGPFVCHAGDGSVDLTRMQERSYQALRTMKQMEFDVPLPFSGEKTNLYDWLVSAVRGIRFRGDTTSSFCCDPANVINIRMQSGYSAALMTNRWSGSASSGLGTGLSGLVEVIVHEARHNQGYGHTCGGFDNTIGELGAIGAASYYTQEWEWSHSDGFLDDVDPSDSLARYRTLAWNQAVFTRDSRTSICTLVPIFASPTSINFGTQPVGSTSPGRTIAVTLGQGQAVAGNPALDVSIEGANKDDFKILKNGCGAGGVTMPPSCSVLVGFSPLRTAPSTAVLSVMMGSAAVGTIALSGSGIPSLPLPANAHSYNLPHVVSGGGYTTKLTVSNLTQQSTNVTVTYLSQTGTLLETKQYGLAKAGTLRLSTPESERFGPMTTKWAIIGSERPVAVNLFFEIQDSSTTGRVVNTVGFNDAPAIQEFSFPVEFEPGTATTIGRSAGLAIANPSAGEATLTIRLRDASGNTIASVDRIVPALGQGAWDLQGIPEFRSALPAQNFVGSVAVSSSVPVSAIALEDDLGPFSAVPIT